LHGSVNGSNATSFSYKNNNHTGFQNNASKNANQISLHIEPNKTKILSPGPAKLKLFIASIESMKPITYEYTLIARP
jgi:hypothetical protein